ncbi:MAG: homoserine dehydrogenase [Acidobacteria bacterium]|nr:homoserine dehydrogenase [Acidobacteriota bacterium]
MNRKPLRVALLGFGTVGSSVARILVERPDLATHVQLTHIFNRDVARKRASWVPSSVAWTDNIDELFAAKPDAVVEVVGGVEPAGAWVRRALTQGASVVTANKMLLAAHAPELLHLAATYGAQLRFEAAVAGGVPLIHGVREGLAGDRLTRVAGILNGTSNYILSRMAGSDEPMSVVLDDARKLGYAEADPSADVDGDDAAAKLVVLAGIAFRRHLRLSDIPRQSIRPISSADFRYARRLGCTIRQIAMVETGPQRAGPGSPSRMPARWDGDVRVGNPATPAEERFHAFVGPALVLRGSHFGLNMGANNVVTIAGHYGGENSFSGAGAGGPATAVAVVSDLLSLTQRTHERGEEWPSARVASPPARPYYLRFVVRDRPGILASIAASLAHQRINLDAVLQEPGYPKDALPFVITVEACEEASLKAALDEIAGSDFHAERPLALPMLFDPVAQACATGAPELGEGERP